MTDTATQVLPAPAKPVWQSKTMWASLFTALAPVLIPLYPPLAAWLGANPQVLTAVGMIFGALRLTSDSAVTLKKG